MTLPATHAMSIVSGLISSASTGFLAVSLFLPPQPPSFSFLQLPYRAVRRINLRSSLPFEWADKVRGKERKSPGVSPFVALEELNFVLQCRRFEECRVENCEPHFCVNPSPNALLLHHFA